MIQEIFSFDTWLFRSINYLPHNLILDSFFGFITLIGYFGAIWLLIAFILLLKNRKKFKNLFAAVFTAEVIDLILVELLIKNRISRLRPQFTVPDTILPYNFSQSFSFPSGHAVIAFAGALILGNCHKKFKWFYYFLAFLIAFSRIYLGKHYPSDVLAGSILGLLIGYFSIVMTRKLYKKNNF